MKRSLFRNLPAVRNKNRPEGRLPVTYVWVTKPETVANVDGVPMGLVVFRRAW